MNALGAGGPATFTLDSFSAGPGTSQVPGTALGAWPAAGSSVELADARQTYGTAGPSGTPMVTAKGASGTALAVTLDPGYGLAAGAFSGAKQIMRLLHAVVASEGVTALVATHDPNLISIADTVLELEDGKIKGSA